MSGYQLGRGVQLTGPRHAFGLLIALLAGWVAFSLPVMAQVDESQLGRSLEPMELQILGKKFPDLPLADRIQLLEYKLHLQSPAHASTEYRISQILNVHQKAVSEDDRHRAIQAYNRAIDKTGQGQTDEAIADCREAIRLDPYLIAAYNNLANLQEKQELYDDATETYRKALTMAPKEPLLHFNLAVVLEKLGHIPEAYEEYRAYIQLSSNPNPQIVSLLRSYDIKRNSGRVETDYVALAVHDSQGERLVWPDWAVPVPVFINLSNQDQAGFVENIYQDFDAWTRVTDGRLRFREVGRADEARIIITLQSGPLMDPSASIGHASFDMTLLDNEKPMQQLRVSIAVNTGDFNSGLTLQHRKEQVSRVVLHELGHAIGIWGHSSDPGDIMYTHPIVSQLSSRDINTIRKLYGLKIAKPSPIATQR